MAFPYIRQGDNITVVIGTNVHTINKRTHPAFDKVFEAIKALDWETVQNCIEPRKVLINYGAGNVSIKGDTVLWNNVPMHTSLTRRMVQMLQEGFDIEHLVKFMDNLMQNPSARAVNELYTFLEKNNLPITENGCFIAWKKVNKEYKDLHTGKIDNSIGQIVEMPRNMVDDNLNNTCSSGLHFCSQEYLKSFGGEHTMILEINPRDVVSIPKDYNDSKGRCCRYKVVGELGVDMKDAPEEFYTAPVQNIFNW